MRIIEDDGDIKLKHLRICAQKDMRNCYPFTVRSCQGMSVDDIYAGRGWKSQK
jgi:hypothetical protein